MDAANGSHIWSETYDRNMKEIIETEREIANRIFEKFTLTMKFVSDQEPPTRNIHAYELYLKGIQKLDKGLVGTQEGIEYLEQAIEFDPDFLKAYSRLSEAYWVTGLYGLEDLTAANTRARNAALKSIDIDPESYIGYRDLSWINFAVDWDWAETMKNIIMP